jgi:hypothetical protein
MLLSADENRGENGNGLFPGCLKGSIIDKKRVHTKNEIEQMLYLIMITVEEAMHISYS